MAYIEVEIPYRCSNDCQQSGCPRHTAVMSYESVSDTLGWQDGFVGAKTYFDLNQLRAFLDGVKDLAERRCEVKSVLTESDQSPEASNTGEKDE